MPQARVRSCRTWLALFVAACGGGPAPTASTALPPGGGPGSSTRADPAQSPSTASDPSAAADTAAEPTGTSGGTEVGPGTEIALGPSSEMGAVEVGTPPALEPVPPEPTLVTSGPGGYWLEGQPELTSDAPTLLVDENTTFQRWDGFGGTFNEAGWDALSVLDAAERQRAVELLFDVRAGAHFTYGRIPIGASDYAMDRYTLSEQAEDYVMASFSIDRDRQLLIPYIQAALAVSPELRLWASPWTPPAWMKDNGSTDGGRIRNEPQVLDAYALYLARFVEDYAALGIAIGAIHPQNEPGYEQTYPTCLWTPELLRDFVGDYLGPKLRERGVSSAIWFGTMSAPQDAQHVAAVMADPTSSPYIQGIGVQWNTLNSVAGFASSYGLPIMQTEHRCGNYPWVTATFNVERAPNDQAYAEESWDFITQWIRAGVNSYSAWNMVLDSVGLNLDVGRPWPQNALLVVDRAAGTLSVTPAYHVFRHLSQFVDPGARRIGTTGDADALAFENPDGSIVTVLHNADAAAREMTLGVGAARLRFSVPARGWATINWPVAASAP